MASTDNTVARPARCRPGRLVRRLVDGRGRGQRRRRGGPGPTQRLRVANSGGARWTPLNLAGIVAHLTGGAVLVVTARMGEQQRPTQVTMGLVRRLLPRR